MHVPDKVESSWLEGPKTGSRVYTNTSGSGRVSKHRSGERVDSHNSTGKTHVNVIAPILGQLNSALSPHVHVSETSAPLTMPPRRQAELQSNLSADGLTSEDDEELPKLQFGSAFILSHVFAPFRMTHNRLSWERVCVLGETRVKQLLSKFFYKHI